MRSRLALATFCFAALIAGATTASANDAALNTAAAASATPSTATLEVGHVTSYVTTQGRRGGGFSGRGRPVIVAGPRRRNNFGRNVAIGVGAAVIGGIIASEAARARPAYRGGNSCARWDYQCSQGAGWACRNLNRYC